MSLTTCSSVQTAAAAASWILVPGWPMHTIQTYLVSSAEWVQLGQSMYSPLQFHLHNTIHRQMQSVSGALCWLAMCDLWYRLNSGSDNARCRNFSSSMSFRLLLFMLNFSLSLSLFSSNSYFFYWGTTLKRLKHRKHCIHRRGFWEIRARWFYPR